MRTRFITQTCMIRRSGNHARAGSIGILCSAFYILCSAAWMRHEGLHPLVFGIPPLPVSNFLLFAVSVSVMANSEGP